MTALDELAAAIAGISEQAGAAVVGLGGGWGSGSGVVLARGQVMTNAHNLRSRQVGVTFPDGRRETATILGADVDGDLAVLEVDTGDATPLDWAPHPAEVAVGTIVFALANPGGRGLRVTAGTVSAVAQAFRGPRGRRIPGGVEHTAPLPRGSSGGPLVDTEGRLLGLNTHRLGGGFYLAVPADASLRERVTALAGGSAPRRVRLGVAIAPGHVARRLRGAVGLAERDGVLVSEVDEGGPGAAAGLRRGDLLVSAAGRDVRSGDDLFEVLDGLSPGDSLPLGVVRGMDETEVTVHFPA